MPGALLLVIASASAQRPVFIVDAAGGAGAQFTDLPAAIAGVPDGAALIVRPGTYSPFAIAGKGIAIVAESDGVVLGSTTSAMVSITATSVRQEVLIRNIDIPALVGIPVVVRDTRGAVVFEDVDFDASLFLRATTVTIERAGNVHFHRCSLGGNRQSTGDEGTAPRIMATDSVLQISHSSVEGLRGRTALVGVSDPGTPALGLIRSRSVAVASSFTGGPGGLGCSSFPGCNALSGPGGIGVVLDQISTLVPLATTVAGAPGGDAFSTPFGGFVPASDGGDGIHASGGSQARFKGGAVIPGPAGSGITPAQPGTAIVVTQGSTVQVNATATPSSAQLLGDSAVGQTLQFELTARPNSTALLILADSAAWTPLEPLTCGSYLSQFLVAIGPLFVPSSGVLRLPFGVPNNWPLGEIYFGQYLTIEPASNQIWATNSFVLNVNG